MDASIFFLSLPIAKGIYKPCQGSLGAFFSITSCDTIAEWHDVPRHGPWTQGVMKGYPVIHGECPPKAFLCTAHSATVIKVIKGLPPMGRRKITRESSKGGLAFLCGNAAFFEEVNGGSGLQAVV